MKANREWDYAPANEKRKHNALSIGSAAGFGLALSHIFNPVAFGLAATYGLAKTAYDYLGKNSEKETGKLVKKGFLEPAENDNRIQAFVNELTDESNSRPLKVYYATDKWHKAQTPLQQSAKQKKIQIEEAANSYAAADSLLGIVVIGKKFQKNFLNEEIRYIIGHEVSHCINEDSSSAHVMAKAFKENTANAMTAAIGLSAAATCVLGVTGVLTMPAVLTASVAIAKESALFFMTTKTANLALNAASRIEEIRADRNSIYLTGEVDAAIDIYQDMIDEKSLKGRKPRPERFETDTHPSFFKRIENLKKAFAEATQYTPLPKTHKPHRPTAVKTNIEFNV